jgi:hypothetical protein
MREDGYRVSVVGRGRVVSDPALPEARKAEYFAVLGTLGAYEISQSRGGVTVWTWTYVRGISPSACQKAKGFEYVPGYATGVETRASLDVLERNGTRDGVYHKKLSEDGWYLAFFQDDCP